ncbi:MAG: hypothetical protein ACRDMI_10010, partial [Streptosporangiaceae bacterium]
LRAGSAGPRVWFWTLRRGFSWFSIQAGLVAPIFLLELVLTNPSYRDHILRFLLLYAAGGGVVLAIGLPYAARSRRYWRSILWAPTWFAFAFLRRIGTLEAAISLPGRPFPAHASTGARPVAPGTAADEPTAGQPASVLFEAAPRDPGGAHGGWADADWADADWDDAGRYDPVSDGLVADGPQEDPVPIPTRPGLLLPEDD